MMMVLKIIREVLGYLGKKKYYIAYVYNEHYNSNWWVG